MVYILHSNKTLAGGKKVTYLYLAHNTRENGIPIREWTIPLGKQEDVEVKFREIAVKQKSFDPESAEPLSSALLCAYLDIFNELGLVEIVDDLCLKSRTQGLTPGHYFLFCILNRLIAPSSKNQVAEWFEGTVLKDLYPNASNLLTAQHIWNHFDYFNEEHLREIFFKILQNALKISGNQVNNLLLDSTNFYTYISNHPFNTLPQKGHNKEGRNHLNIVNLSLMIHQENEIPIYFKIYPGNIPDSQYFMEILPEISDWVHRLCPDRPEPGITVVFDKGNNSLDAMNLINKYQWGFIGSLRPSMFKELLQEPFTEFTKIYDTHTKHAVYAFRREAIVYTKDPVVVIVTFDEKVHDKCLNTLQYHIAKRFDQLQEFSIVRLNSKPQWRDPEKIRKHIDTQILIHKDFKKMITIILEGVMKDAVEYQELRWGLNDTVYTEQTNTFGKAIIFSNKRDWSTKEIVLGYRQQYKVEQKFEAMKATDYIQIRPIYHWTDKNIRIHIFLCILAIMGQVLLKLKFKTLKFKGSFLDLTNALNKIQKIHLYYDKGRYTKTILPQIDQTQQELLSKLELGHYFS